MPNRRTFLNRAATAAGAASIASIANGNNNAAADSAVGGYNYQRPKLARGTRLLFQGDSITDMKWGRNQNDRNHYLGHSYVYLIASRLGVDMPTAELEFINRGHSGNTVAQLRERWQKDAIDIAPDVLSILIGVNDVGRMVRSKQDRVPLEKWEADYRGILDASLRANSKLMIVLLDPFVLPSKRFGEGEHQKWRGEIDKLCEIVSSLANDYQATHVRTQTVFDEAAKIAQPEHWIWDGVHPLPQGHELIARNWLQQCVATRAE